MIHSGCRINLIFMIIVYLIKNCNKSIENNSNQVYYCGMNEMKLTDYLIDGTQQEVADALKVTQGAVYQMVSNNRDVRLVLNNKGQIVRATEIKTFPTGKHGTRK